MSSIVLNTKQGTCSKETMIDTRPGTSTVGVQCSIWDRPPLTPTIQDVVEEFIATIGKIKDSIMQASTSDAELPISALDTGLASRCSMDNAPSTSFVVYPQASMGLDDDRMELCQDQELEEPYFNERTLHKVEVNEDHSGMTEEYADREQRLQAEPEAVEHESYTQKSTHMKCPSMDDESYEIMVEILSGRFVVPAKERTRKHRAAFTRLWRNKERYTVDRNVPPSLYYDGKRILRSFEIGHLVSTYMGPNGRNTMGVRRIQHSLRQAFAGVSRSAVEKIMNGTKGKKKQRQLCV